VNDKKYSESFLYCLEGDHMLIRLIRFNQIKSIYTSNTAVTVVYVGFWHKLCFPS